MAGYQNNMSVLISKAERRLGLIPLTPYLPPETFGKEKWAEVVREDTLDTFSRFYPKKIPFRINRQTAPKKGGWRYIDEGYVGNQKILGAGDIDWTEYASNSLGLAQQFGYGLPDIGMTNMSMDDIQTLGIRANYASMFNNNVYPDFQPPNRLRICSVGNNDVNIGDFTISLYVKHTDDLASITPTKMETFERLAIADIAVFLSQNLKYWDGLESVLNTLDLKLGKLEDEAAKRDQIVDDINNTYVSAGNESIPFIMTC